METWLSYDLSDLLMFSARTYYRQIELANAAAWPLHVAATAGGLLLAFCLLKPSPPRNRMAALILALAWASSGWFFIASGFATIHWAGAYAISLFAVGAAFLAAIALTSHGLNNGDPAPRPAWSRLAAALTLAAAFLYPALAPLSGRPLASAETFGIAADPTALVTLLVAALTARGWRLLAMLPPGLWLAFSTSALWAMGSAEAWVVLAGLVAAPVVMLARRFTPDSPAGASIDCDIPRDGMTQKLGKRP
jgi:hypothetical protein